MDLETKAERWSDLSKATQLAKSTATFELRQSELRALKPNILCYLSYFL